MVTRPSPRSSPFLSTATLQCAQSGSKTTLLGQIKASSLPNVSKISKLPPVVVLPHYRHHRRVVVSPPCSDDVNGGVTLEGVTVDTAQKRCSFKTSGIPDETRVCSERPTDVNQNGQISPNFALQNANDNDYDFVHSIGNGNDTIISKCRNFMNSSSEKVDIYMCGIESVHQGKTSSVASSLDDVFSASCEIRSTGKLLKRKREETLRNSSTSSKSLRTRSADSDLYEAGSDGSISLSSGNVYFHKPRNGSKLWKPKKKKKRRYLLSSGEPGMNSESTMGLLEQICIHKPYEDEAISERQIFSEQSKFSGSSEQYANGGLKSKSEARLMSPKVIFQRMFSWNVGKSKRPKAKHSSRDQLSRHQNTMDIFIGDTCDPVNVLISFPSIEKLHIRDPSDFKAPSASVKYKKTNSNQQTRDQHKTHLLRCRSDPCIYNSDGEHHY